MDFLTLPFKKEKDLFYPKIVIKVEGFEQYLEALLDTGADFTIFPYEYEKKLNHNNNKAISNKAAGIGGSAKFYIHTLQISLFDQMLEKVWTSPDLKIGIASKYSNIKQILLGRDLICHTWRRIIFNTESSNPHKWEIQIFPS